MTGCNTRMAECFDSGMVNYSKYLIHKGMVTAPFYICCNISNAQADLGYAGRGPTDLPKNSYWHLPGIGGNN